MFGRGFDGNTIMNLRQLATAAVLLCGTVVLAPVENTGAVSVESSRSPSLSADTDARGPVADNRNEQRRRRQRRFGDARRMGNAHTERLAISDKQEAIVIAALPDSSQMLPAGSPSVQAKASTPDLAPVENTGAVSVESSPSPSLSADTDLGGVLQPTAASNVSVANGDLATPAEWVTRTTERLAISDKQEAIVIAALPDSSQMLPAGSQSVQAKASTPALAPNDLKEIVSSIDIDECFVADSCIDQYLWALYQRTPKADTVKVHERRKATVKKKGKMVTVTKRFTRLVNEDFTWKDPKAAEKAGIPMMDYVIGGMDRSFRLKLFRTLRAAEEAGLSPGITSAFRDDYRQSIASGLKAATDKSYHGGSFRGGYGHGLAADVVSVKGMTQAQRWISTENLWKWIDARGKDFGIGRPYLDKDPPHVAPVDGKEYAAHRRGTKAQHAASDMKKRDRLAVDDHGFMRTTSSHGKKAEMLIARSDPEMSQSRP